MQKDSIKREQSQAGLSFAERKNFRPKVKRNRLLLLLVLLMTAATGAWADETPLLTIESTDYADFRSGSMSFDDKVTVTFSDEVENDGDTDGWYRSGAGSLLTVAGINGYTITSCKFYTKTGAAKTGYTVEGESPSVYLSQGFVYTDDSKSVNLGTVGVKKIEVYGAAAPAGYTVSLKDGVKDADKWTISPNPAEEGQTVTLQYNGRLKVKGVKATSDAAPAAPAYAANEYNEASWDGTKVVFTKKTAASDPTAVANSDADVTWDAGWYTVSGNVTINGKVTLTADAHLILQDGATLTINGQLNCRTNSKNLYIYGQKKGDGKLIVTNNSDKAINSNRDLYIDIHGGEVTAAAAGDYSYGIYTGHLAVYGGKLTATSNSSHGINFQNTIDVYGGEVVATSNATSSAFYGFRSSAGMDNQILTVYGGKVTATGNGVSGMADYGSGFGCHVKSGTSGIKFYFSADGTTWGDGTSYASVTKVGADDATKKRYAKAE